MKFLATLLGCLLPLLLCTLQGRAADALPPAVVLPATVKEMSPVQVAAYLVEHPDTYIIDARTEEERRTRGFLLNSRHHDYFHGREALAEVDKTKPCLVYCALGGRSQRLALELHKLGFEKLVLIKGGFNVWVAEGMAVER